MDDVETKPPSVDPKYYTLREASTYLNRSIGAVRKLKERNQLEWDKLDDKHKTVIVRLDDEVVRRLWIPPGKEDEDGDDEDGDGEDLRYAGWLRHSDHLTTELAQSRLEAGVLRQALDDERRARDAERAYWTTALAEVTAQAKAAREMADRDRAERDAARASASKANSALSALKNQKAQAAVAPSATDKTPALSSPPKSVPNTLKRSLSPRQTQASQNVITRFFSSWRKAPSLQLASIKR